LWLAAGPYWLEPPYADIGCNKRPFGLIQGVLYFR